MPRLGGFNLDADTDTVVYTAPVSKRATITVSMCNRAQGNCIIYIGLVPSGSIIGDSDYIEYGTNVGPGNTIERTGITPYNGEKIIVRSNSTNVSAVVWGYEE